MQPTASPIDELGEENRKAYGKLVEVLAAKPTVALVGAGLSRRVGYPLWEGLLAELKTHACTARPADVAKLEALGLKGGDMLVAAEEYKLAMGPQLFGELIRRVFGPRDPQHDAVHQGLVSLPFRHFLTTNYDHALEDACRAVSEAPVCLLLDDKPQVGAFIDSLNNPETKRHCVHLHGSSSQPDNVVLTLADYNRVYIDQKVWTKHVVDTLCAMHAVVFVGFSFTDADLMGPFRELASLLGGGEPKHFAIVESPGADKLDVTRTILRKRYRVEPIFYDGRDGHAHLEPLVRQLGTDIAQAQQNRRPSSIEALLRDTIDGGGSGAPRVDANMCSRFETAAKKHGFKIEMSNALVNADGREPVDQEIDAIFAYVQNGLPDVAIGKYNEIMGRQGLSDRVKYRLHANIGNALSSQNDYFGAADKYLVAVSFYKNSRDARSLEMLAYFFRGDHAKAYELACGLCREYPDYGRVQSVRIRTSGLDLSSEEAEASVPEELKNDAEVLMALADLASRHGNSEVQEQYVRRALAANPDWLDVPLSLAALLIVAEKEEGIFGAEEGLVLRDPQKVLEAKGLLDDAIEKAPLGDSRLAGAYLNRSVAHRLLKKHKECRRDVAEAFRCDPTDLDIVLAEAQGREVDRNVDGAIACLEAFRSGDPTMRRDFLLALFLAGRGRGEDLDRSLQILSPWVEKLGDIEHPNYCMDICNLAMQLFTRMNRPDDAQKFLERLPKNALPVSNVHVLWAKFAISGKRRDVAQQQVVCAAEMLAEDASLFDQREVAVLAQELEQWSIAFQSWKKIVPTTPFVADARNLLRTAHFAGEEKFIFDFCSGIRKSGVKSKECYHIEADMLARHHEPEKSISLLQEWMAEHPDDLDTQLSISVLALQSGLSSYVVDDPNRLPPVASVTNTQRGIAAVYVLRHSKRPEAGLEYAYELWRRFPDAMETQHSLVISLFNPKAPPLTIVQPAVVEIGCAVEIRQANGSPRWVVIEPGPNPSSTRREYPPSHPLAQALIGRAIGQEAKVGNQIYQIQGIRNRLVLRAQECLYTFEENFPDKPYFQRFSVDLTKTEKMSAEEMLGDILKPLQQQEEWRKQLEGLHQGRRLPLSLVAKSLGKTIFGTMSHFAGSPGLSIPCCIGSPDEKRNAQNAIGSGGAVVLDSTAVATLYFLGYHTKLAKFPFRCIVPRSVLEELRELISDIGNSGQPSGTIGSIDGKLYFQEHSVDELVAQVKGIEELLEALKAACEVAGGADLLSLDGELRKSLVDMLGEASAEAMAIAKVRGALLWTDDLTTSVVANTKELQVQRVWTQIAIWRARDEGKISPDESSDASGKLLTLGYSFTSLTVDEIVRSLQSQGWDIRAGVSGAVYRQACEIGTQSAINCGIYAVSILKIWKNCPDKIQAKKVIFQFLEGMGYAEADRKIARLICNRRILHGLSETEHRQFRKMILKWRITTSR